MSNIRTATITFHAAHNYGSALQAFALQQTLINNGCKNEIINLRTKRQKDLYTVFTKRGGIKYLAKNLTHLLYYPSLKRRYERYEDFIKDKMICTQEYETLEDLKKTEMNYDCYISGSDQIWNPVPLDFDWSYYLPFVKDGKRISYATSFGQLVSCGDEETKQKIRACLCDFDKISVREIKAKEKVSEISNGEKEAEVVLDPAMLLSAEQWDELLPTQSMKKEYIFFYTLFATPEYMQIIKKISKITGLPVITSYFSNQHDFINPFIKRYDTGPIEFLQLVRNAKLVVTSSFHGTVFSVLFNTPFYAINGDSDARISTLLNQIGLSARTVSDNTVEDKLKNGFDVDFACANAKIEEERQKSLNWLLDVLK